MAFIFSIRKQNRMKRTTRGLTSNPLLSPHLSVCSFRCCWFAEGWDFPSYHNCLRASYLPLPLPYTLTPPLFSPFHPSPLAVWDSRDVSSCKISSCPVPPSTPEHTMELIWLHLWPPGLQSRPLHCEHPYRLVCVCMCVCVCVCKCV